MCNFLFHILPLFHFINFKMQCVCNEEKVVHSSVSVVLSAALCRCYAVVNLPQWGGGVGKFQWGHRGHLTDGWILHMNPTCQIT